MVVDSAGGFGRAADVAETSVSIVLCAVTVACAWLTSSWFVGGGGGGGVVGSVGGITAGVGLFCEEDSCCGCWVDPDVGSGDVPVGAESVEGS